MLQELHLRRVVEEFLDLRGDRLCDVGIARRLFQAYNRTDDNRSVNCKCTSTFNLPDEIHI